MFPSTAGSRALLTSALLAVLAMQPGQAQEAMPSVPALPSGREVLRRAEEVRSPDMDYAVEFLLEASDPASSWKERTASYMMIAHGKDYSLVMMREPSQFYPGTLLIAKGFYWLLLPRSDRAFQLAPRHVLNGDISNGDLARGNLLAFYEPRLQGEALIRGEPCWHLELTRTTNMAMYKKIHAWITKKDYRPWRFHYYGETGALLKVADYEDYRQTTLGVRSMRIRVQNKMRPGEETVLTFSRLRKIDASVLDYTREALPAFRDAALAQQRLDGEQAQAEDLLRLLGKPGS